MVNTGQATFDGTVYVGRRIVSGLMANDVGYLHSVITMPGGEAVEQVQKFSWVFLKENGAWRVVIAMPHMAPEGLRAAFIMVKLDGELPVDPPPDPTRGSLYYHATYVYPRWSRSLTRTARIGSHVFNR